MAKARKILHHDRVTQASIRSALGAKNTYFIKYLINTWPAHVLMRMLAALVRSRPERIVISDDREATRVLLRILLGHEPHLDIVGEAADGDEAVKLAIEQGGASRCAWRRTADDEQGRVIKLRAAAASNGEGIRR